MRDAEGVVHIGVLALDELEHERGVVGLLSRRETQVLEELGPGQQLLEPVVGQLQQLNLGGAKVDDGRLYLRFVLHAKQFDAVEIDLGNIACVDAVMA